MPAEVLQLWEQRDNESPEAFEAFETYRKMGYSRSLAKVAAQLGKSTPLMEQWASPRRHEWSKRVRAWDRHEARRINDEILTGTASMRQRLANQAMNMQLRAATVIHDMTPAELKRMTPGQIAAFFRVGADVEMKARAIPREEQDKAEREDAPTFAITFVASKPDGMVSVRLASGEAGYIPAGRVEEFLAENEGGVAIQ